MSQKTMLIILDGLGLNPIEDGNPIFEIKTPVLDNVLKSSPHLNLSASAEAVGLSWGEVGNSEVGHSNIGTGQIIWQDLPRITNTIKDGSFFKNEVINQMMDLALKNKSSLHLVGLVSDGGVHSHIEHLFALLKMAKNKNIEDVFIHAFTDGRDTAPKCASRYFEAVEAKTKELGRGKVSSISGRFYAMDRDNHWERIEKVYDVMTGESNRVAKSALEAIKHEYEEGKNDENIDPTIIGLGTPKQFIKDDDVIIIFNFRADRAREITLSLGQKNFKHFKRKKEPTICLSTMTPYETDWKIKINTIFSSLEYQSPLSDVFAEKKFRQLHIAETEKYAHVTYFFNGGREKKLMQEDYICIPSPRIESYAQKPEMSLPHVTSELLGAINKTDYQFVVANFANPDMVGHTGDFEAAKKALLSVDKNLGYLIPAAQKKGFSVFITADHGNIEQMINLETKEIDKEHTTNPVFFIRVATLEKQIMFSPEEHQKIWQEISLESPKGVLADITPTIAMNLAIQNISYFSGQSLNDIFSNNLNHTS